MTMTFRQLVVIIEFAHILVMAGMWAAIALLLWAMLLMHNMTKMFA